MRIEFHFDFGSPNAYLVHKLLPDLAQRTNTPIHYIPVLLGGVFKLTGNVAPMVQFKGIRNKNEYQRLEMQRFIKRHGLSAFRMNPHFPVNTVQIMRGAVAAEVDGTGPAYVDAVFQQMWEAGAKLDDADVIRRVLDAADLNGAHTLARIQDQAVKDRLTASTEASVARGNFGSPTIFVGSEMYFGKDRLGDVEEEIRRGTA